MWDLIVSVPDQCLSFYFVQYPAVISTFHRRATPRSNVYSLLFSELAKMVQQVVSEISIFL